MTDTLNIQTGQFYYIKKNRIKYKIRQIKAIKLHIAFLMHKAGP